MRTERWGLVLGGIGLTGIWLAGGCPQPNDSTTSTTALLAASSTNAPTVKSVVSRTEQMLRQGSSVDSITTALLSTLQADARVMEAGIDTTEDTVWVDFVDGESQCFLIVDEAKDAAASLKALDDRKWDGLPTPAAAPAPVISPAQQAKIGAAAQGTASGIVYTQPASNKALLANALNFIHHKWDISDSTDLIEKMLKARGYDVTRHDLTVADFENLTNYGVIVLETHGTWRDPQYAPELLQLPASLGISYTGTCGGDYARQTILTSTPVTADNLKSYYRDLMCGRLRIWNVTIHKQDGTTTKQQYYGVTPNYVREYDSGTFPNNTLFLLNACRGARSDLSSEFRDMLFEKCNEGACFLGWAGKVFYPRAARAALYLFQLLTASNEEKIVAGKTVLEKFTPPQGGNFTYLLIAMGELNKKLYLTDLDSGAQLTPWLQDQAIILPVLAPHPRWCTPQLDGTWDLRMFACDKPTVTVGGSAVSAKKTVSWGDSWTVTGLKTGRYGDIVVTEYGVSGLARPLRRWRPTIKVTGNNDGLQYTVTFTPQARATLGPNSLRTSVWSDPPPAQICDTNWDEKASVIAWNVTGQRTTTDYDYQFSGSGSRAFGANDGGGLVASSSGTGMDLTIFGEISYTTTATNRNTHAVTTSLDTTTISVSRDGVSLSDDLTIAGASFKQSVGFNDKAQVSWSAFGPTPSFNKDSEPR